MKKAGGAGAVTATASKSKPAEVGSVLVLTLLLTLVILGIGLMAMWMASSATKASSKLMRQREAKTAVSLGMLRARFILLRGLGSANLPGFSAALQGLPCSPRPSDPRARMAAFVPNKGRLLCDNVDTRRPAIALQDVPVVMAPPSKRRDHAVIKVDELAQAQFTAYVRNDDDEYRHCNGVLERGERSDSGHCPRLRLGMSSAQQRALMDEDSRVILRVEGRGRDGLSFAAVEVVLSGSKVVPIRNAYTQANVDAQNSNATSCTPQR